MQRLEPLEHITVELLDEDGVESMIRKGELLHSMALVAWLEYKAVKIDVDRENNA